MPMFKVDVETEISFVISVVSKPHRNITFHKKETTCCLFVIYITSTIIYF